MSLKEDGVEFKQLDDGQSKNAWFVVMAWGCWRAVEPGLHQHRSAAVEEESRAELSGAHPLAGAMERPWAGAETGAGQVVRGLRRWSWRPRQRRWWCWDLALCCCHLWTGKGNDHLQFPTEV